MRWDGTAPRVICPSGAGHEEQEELLLGKSLTLLVCLFVCLLNYTEHLTFFVLSYFVNEALGSYFWC